MRLLQVAFDGPFGTQFGGFEILAEFYAGAPLAHQIVITIESDVDLVKALAFRIVERTRAGRNEQTMLFGNEFLDIPVNIIRLFGHGRFGIADARLDERHLLRDHAGVVGSRNRFAGILFGFRFGGHAFDIVVVHERFVPRSEPEPHVRLPRA